MKEHFCPAEQSTITYQGECSWCGEKEALAQTQEPVAWWNDTGTHIDLNVSGRGTPLYTSPPQRTWVGLTDDDKHEIELRAGITEDDDGYIVSQVFKLTEAKLKELNT